MNFDTFATKLKQREFPLEWPGHFVQGKWNIESGSAETAFNPNDGSELIKINVGDSQIRTAIETAEGAMHHLVTLSLENRIKILQRLTKVLRESQETAQLTLRLSAGKPLWEAKADVDSALRHLDWVIENSESIFESLLAPAKLGRTEDNFTLLPIGTTVCSIPFSTPVTSFVSFFSASVLAGCPLVVVSSAHTAISTLMFATIAQTIELPPSMLQVVFGNFNTFKTAFTDKRVVAVLYTGSREHCETIRRESRSIGGRQLVVQSGGKNAIIVDDSADLDLAVKSTVFGTLKACGQLCAATSRAFVHESILEKFTEELATTIKKIKIDRTDTDDDPFMGPLYSQKAVEKFLRFQTMAHREVSEIISLGKSFATKSKGYFVTPGIQIMKEFNNRSAFQSNVLFSPHLAVYPFSNLDSAIDMANDTDSAYSVAYMGDPTIIESKRHLFMAPNLSCNMPTVAVETTLPLAGRLQSGHHRYHGPGIALYLCYPQVLRGDENGADILNSWPWP